MEFCFVSIVSWVRRDFGLLLLLFHIVGRQILDSLREACTPLVKLHSPPYYTNGLRDLHGFFQIMALVLFTSLFILTNNSNLKIK
jgi:hypothetical protein